jgi:hypothetical protein
MRGGGHVRSPVRDPGHSAVAIPARVLTGPGALRATRQPRCYQSGDPALPGVEQQTVARRKGSAGLRAVVRRTQTQVQRGRMQGVPGLARNENMTARPAVSTHPKPLTIAIPTAEPPWSMCGRSGKNIQRRVEEMARRAAMNSKRRTLLLAQCTRRMSAST